MTSIWLRGQPPKPPGLTEKLIDWQALASAGGIELIQGKTVMDIGPCYGLEVMMLAPHAKRYVALELDDYAADRIRKLVPEAELVCEDAKAMPFTDLTFDTVLDFGTIDNIEPPQQVYLEVYRVLKPGGAFVTTYANALKLGGRHSDSLDETRQFPDELHMFLESVGFKVMQRLFENQTRAALYAVKGKIHP